MQGMARKKETSNVTICPKCGAKNLTAQDHCGKCGFIFPKDEADAHRGRKKGPVADFSGQAQAQVGEEGGEEKPIVTAHHKIEARSEGLLKERGEWKNCPRCGADVKPDAKRCIRCGWKIKK